MSSDLFHFFHIGGWHSFVNVANKLPQFCGVNVIAYYSSQIFLDGGFSPVSALSASLGFGLINWLFAIPAIYTIDTFGRRNLLLTTYP